MQNISSSRQQPLGRQPVGRRTSRRRQPDSDSSLTSNSSNNNTTTRRRARNISNININNNSDSESNNSASDNFSSGNNSINSNNSRGFGGPPRVPPIKPPRGPIGVPPGGPPGADTRYATTMIQDAIIPPPPQPLPPPSNSEELCKVISDKTNKMGSNSFLKSKLPPSIFNTSSQSDFKKTQEFLIQGPQALSREIQTRRLRLRSPARQIPKKTRKNKNG